MYISYAYLYFLGKRSYCASDIFIGSLPPSLAILINENDFLLTIPSGFEVNVSFHKSGSSSFLMLLLISEMFFYMFTHFGHPRFSVP